MDINHAISVLNQLNITKEFVHECSLHCGFKKRNRKIDPHLLLISYLMIICGNTVSYNLIASLYASLLNITISRQAIHKTVSKPGFITFIQHVFTVAICIKIKDQLKESVNNFHRIIVQDSTIIKGPSNLFSVLSGVSNGTKQVTNARLQLAINIKNSTVEMFSIDSYSDNDLKVAANLIVCENDLILRDRGYFKVSEITRFISAGAYFVLRYFDGVSYYDIDGNPIDILKLLKKHKELDIVIRVGAPDNQTVRLVAKPVTKKVGDTRRTKLLKESKHAPSERSKQLQNWSVYITNLVDKKDWTFTKIASMYALRWRIEIIFKAIKSFIQLNSKGRMSEYQYRGILYLKLMLFAIILNRIYLEVGRELNLSILKLCQQTKTNIDYMMQTILNLENIKVKHNTKNWLTKYCSYEINKKRCNFNQQMDSAA
jgi:hypothetical protein